MKKLMFFLSTFIFVLFVPNIVNAETYNYQIGSNYRTLTWGNQTSLYAYFSDGQATYDNFEGIVSFNIIVNPLIQFDDSVVPSEVYLYTSERGFVCTIDSTFIPQDVNYPNNNSIYIMTMSCPISITHGYLSRIQLYRRNTATPINQSNLYMPTYITLYSTNNASLVNAQNGTTNAVNDVNSSINNDNVSTNTENSSTASSWASNNASDSVVSDMVLMPITLLNAFSNGFNGICSPYNLGSFFGTNLVLPCINISNYLGATLWGIIDVLMSGFLIYGIGKKFVRVFNDFTNLKDSQVDELYGGGNQ